MTPVSQTVESDPGARRRALRDILLYGLCGGVLIAVLKLTEYRFLVVEHSVEIYGALIAALFAGLGIWLGQTLTSKKAGADRQRQHRQGRFRRDALRRRRDSGEPTRHHRARA